MTAHAEETAAETYHAHGSYARRSFGCAAFESDDSTEDDGKYHALGEFYLLEMEVEEVGCSIALAWVAFIVWVVVGMVVLSRRDGVWAPLILGREKPPTKEKHESVDGEE